MKEMIFIMLLVVAGCSTPTDYISSEKGKDGYTDKIIDADLRLTTFKGNAKTKKETAELYAKFRAIEICQELGRTYTHFMLVKDKTFSKDIAQTTPVGPTYYYGASPYYGRYGAGWGMSYSTPTTTTTETYTYPMYEVYFECTDKPLDARISLKNLSQSQVQNLVKDAEGAVQIDEVLSDSPNIGKLQKGDIVVKAGGERVGAVLDVYKVSRRYLQRNFKVEFFREGKRKVTTVGFADVSEQVKEAQEKIIKEACKMDSIKDEKKDICKE